MEFLLPFFVFCPNGLKNRFFGRFGCFFKVPKFQDLTPNFHFVRKAHFSGRAHTQTHRGSYRGGAHLKMRAKIP